MDSEEFYFDEGGADYDEDDNLDEYKTPTGDEEYGGGEEEEGFIVEESRIEMGAEWRDYGDDISKSRVGIARAVDIEEDLGTMIDEKFKRMEQISRSPEDMFKILARKIKDKYELSEGVYDDSLRIMQYTNKQNRKIKFKNPGAILFALLCIKDNKIIDENIETIYETMAKHERMTKIDLLRYIFYVNDLLKTKGVV